jgi:hypothetical protein
VVDQTIARYVFRIKKNLPTIGINNMAKLKVLPLPAYVHLMVKRGELHSSGPCLINRDGFYLFKDECWLEYSGRSYARNKLEFLLELKILNAPIYTQAQYKMLRTLRSQKALSKEMLAKLAAFELWVESFGLPAIIRAQRVNTRLKRFVCNLTNVTP